MVEKAKYSSLTFPHAGNPLIEALPQFLQEEESIHRLAQYPEWDKEISRYDIATRVFSMDSLYNDFFQPLPQTLILKNNIERLIKQGYVSRNPISDFQDRRIGMANSLTLLGVAGMGKTVSIDRILALYPQVIKHTEYHGQRLIFNQIVYLKLNCPYNGSIKGLLYQLYGEIDRLTGENWCEKFKRSRATVESMIQSSYKIAKASQIGVIVLDEVQHLANMPEKNKDILLNFLVTLTNTIRVPLIYVGTPAAYGVLNRDLRQARRSSGTMGDLVWDKYENDEVFKLLVQKLWRYQITNRYATLTKEILDTLYYESQGIIDVLMKLHSLVQVYATQNKYDEVTPSMIQYVANSLSVMKPILQALKSGNRKFIFEYKDVYMPIEHHKSNDIQIKESSGRYYQPQKINNIITEEKKKTKKAVKIHRTDDIRIIASTNTDNKCMTVYERLKAAGLIKSEVE
jgi:hypothetical protein